MKRLLTLLTLLTLCGCTRNVPVAVHGRLVEMPIPARPPLPEVREADLEPLEPAARERWKQALIISGHHALILERSLESYNAYARGVNAASERALMPEKVR